MGVKQVFVTHGHRGSELEKKIRENGSHNGNESDGNNTVKGKRAVGWRRFKSGCESNAQYNASMTKEHTSEKKKCVCY
jgi:hypothetical protein